MVCKCQRVEEYWNATGTSHHGNYTRRDLMSLLVIGAIPILGQFILILISITSFYESRSLERVPLEFRNIKRKGNKK